MEHEAETKTSWQFAKYHKEQDSDIPITGNTRRQTSRNGLVSMSPAGDLALGMDSNAGRKTVSAIPQRDPTAAAAMIAEIKRQISTASFVALNPDFQPEN